MRWMQKDAWHETATGLFLVRWYVWAQTDSKIWQILFGCTSVRLVWQRSAHRSVMIKFPLI